MKSSTISSSEMMFSSEFSSNRAEVGNVGVAKEIGSTSLVFSIGIIGVGLGDAVSVWVWIRNGLGSAMFHMFQG